MQLKEAVALYQQRPLSNIEKQGFIKAFEFTHELSWKVIKDFAVYQGNTQIIGARDATRFAFANEIISEGESWMEMIGDRNRAVHTYDEHSALLIIAKTAEVYYRLFLAFEKRMQGLVDEQ